MRAIITNLKAFILFFGLILLLVTCSTPEQTAVQQNNSKPDNRYDSEFPARSVSKKLEFASTTVKKLDCLVFYMTYVFAPDNTIDPGHLTDSVLQTQSLSYTVTNESVTGTATVIYYDGSQVGLLTCAHVVEFTDTLITRYFIGF